ncbi:hypothetical protein [Streptomyces sp. CRN 30]|uniref:hypothetical protein n=1 Tax=Streptomyces sp. CRN 30 TaxID=3075613 RepID=UPI002A7FF300|nr:hypothetical protein [Streptomyces sp. CRN 30]
MDHVEVPYRIFERLLAGFARAEGKDIAFFGRDAETVVPGDAFGDVFAWLWEERRETAVAAFADLLAEARRDGDVGDEVRLESLINGLRSALFRSRLGEEETFWEVGRTLREHVPDHFGGRSDL